MTKAELRAIAEAAAQTHPITRVAEGEGLNLTSKEWGEAVREPGYSRYIDRKINERRTVQVAGVGEVVVNGLGEAL